MFLADVRSKVVDSVFIVAPIVCGDLFCSTVLCVLFSFEIISLGKRKLVALLLLCSKYHVAVILL